MKVIKATTLIGLLALASFLFFGNEAMAHCGVCGAVETASDTAQEKMEKPDCTKCVGKCEGKCKKGKGSDRYHGNKKVKCPECGAEFAVKGNIVEPEAKEVKYIGYEDFQSIIAGEKKFTIVDVLSPDSYQKGHIPGAISFPLGIINEDTAPKILEKDSLIVVYCANLKCKASTKATQKLLSYGYEAVDYEEGLQGWQDNGGELKAA